MTESIHTQLIMLSIAYRSFGTYMTESIEAEISMLGIACMRFGTYMCLGAKRRDESQPPLSSFSAKP